MMGLNTITRCDRVLLYHLSWQQFEQLVQELGEQGGVRIAYDSGTLEILTPLPDHERYKESLSDIIKDMAEVLERDYLSLGSTTWKRERQLAGVEADNCFYFENESRVRGRSTVNLEQDPPPDLVLEIDLTHKSLNRLPIYARLGVPELWNYDVELGELRIYQLQGQGYESCTQSRIFPEIAIAEIPQLLKQYEPQGQLAMRRQLREWVRRQLS
ncbi:Uma2 family endonuclease [Phormidium yuhuli AB48]|uniref:Uma2 family endonuclease n=1 Tax=Phormidium yuhuli AB48 TaxID=2940671 RepID=A0ABY5ANS1_9CYAN|nr:Uma2 family endonuclease [Phormidium yuhuli]USR90869.1 Uma2 family endonuclease [Phormidium yuhuli AB48]